MAGITSAGVGSGLDLEAIIKATVDAETLPKIAQLDKKEGAIDLQITAIGQMKSDLTAFSASLDILKDIDNFTKRASTVTQPETGGDLISVSSTSTATVGAFKITDVTLAQGSRAVQDDANDYDATTDVVSATGGTLTFTAGAKTFDVVLAAGATLAELRTAINDQADNFGVSANIINTGGAIPSSKLVLTSSESGTGNDLTVTNSTAELDKVSTAAFGGGNGGMVIAAADVAKDATMKIDGITTTSSTNVFTDAIQDSTITVLRASDTSAPTTDFATLKVDTDKEFVKKTIEDFVSSFNKIIDTASTVVTSKTADATARGLRNMLIQQAGNLVGGANALTSIYDIGISLDKNNNLIVDADAVNTLDDALKESYDDIGTLFAGTDGVATILAASVDTYLKSSGVFKSQTDALDTQKKGVTEDRDSHAYRMDLFEKRLREKYANLDVLIAGLRSQGTAITSSLANLPGFTRQK
jgi:flagellar hook-associated protein 2